MVLLRRPLSPAFRRLCLAFGSLPLMFAALVGPVLLGCVHPTRPTYLEYAVPIGQVSGDSFPSCEESCDGMAERCRYAEWSDGPLSERLRVDDVTAPMPEAAEYVAVCYVPVGRHRTDSD